MTTIQYARVKIALLVVAALLTLAWVAWGAPAYRRADWPHWRGEDTWETTDGSGATCRADTRDVVIRRAVRGASLTITRGGDGGCIVRGDLLDFYGTDGLLRSADAIEVDHLVPLGEAHRAGGWRWSREQKARYANYLTIRFYLLPVSAVHNQQKGNRGPQDWIPTNPAIHCQYGLWWATVKYLEGLSSSEAERAAVRGLLLTC